MATLTHRNLEVRLLQLCREKKFQDVAYESIRGYGPEILGWLSSLTKDETQAEDIFQKFCLSLWRGLPSFQGNSQISTWIYRIAWNEFLAYQQKKSRQKEKQVSPSQLNNVVQEVTTLHTRMEKSQQKNRLVELRQQLSEELQTLLILRIDREMDFASLAEVLGITKETARKRFQRAKEQLKILVAKEKKAAKRSQS